MPADNLLPMCYLNGQYIPFAEAKLPVYDLAVMQGATVTERLRTFAHEPYDVPAHLTRLRQSLHLVGWEGVPEVDALEEIIHKIARQNSRLIPGNSDLAVVLFVTAGQGLGDANGLIEQSTPTVCVYTAPLPLRRYASWYTMGVKLEVSSIRQHGAETLNPHIKMRSRLHWQLADQEIHRRNADAMALLLDRDGHITETSSGNILCVKNGIVRTPMPDKVLSGISRGHVESLCRQLNIPFEFTDLTTESIHDADEVFLTSSTYCLIPVSFLSNQPIGDSVPGELTTVLTDAWSHETGLNFRDQAIRVAASSS